MSVKRYTKRDIEPSAKMREYYTEYYDKILRDKQGRVPREVYLNRCQLDSLFLKIVRLEKEHFELILKINKKRAEFNNVREWLLQNAL